jgi:hypothetical protein
MERGFIDTKTDKLDTCVCGTKPTQYSLGFGSTPYSVHCPGCKKSTNSYREVGGMPQNIIDFWNLIAPLKEMSVRTYRVGQQKFTWKDSLRMRDQMVNNNDYKVFVLFENGEIEYAGYRRFLFKGIDY